MPYASKELIERAVDLAGRTFPYGTISGFQGDLEDLARDLARATELPDNWCAPVGDAIMGEYRPDAQKPIDEGDANRLMALIDAALASGSPVTEIAMDHDGTPCRLVLASGDGIKLVDSWARGLIGEPATEPTLPEPTEQEAFVAGCDLHCEHGIPSGFCTVSPSCGDPKPEPRASSALSTPPQPNHASGDRRLTAFLREYGSYKPGTLVRLDEAALAELCRRALGGR
jgi:hypothetical protein